MKTFSLLRLEHGANKVIFTCSAPSVVLATKTFNERLSNVQLDEQGYAKISETVSFCVAEHWEPLLKL